jgi:putative superfamily III holin-X
MQNRPANLTSDRETLAELFGELANGYSSLFRDEVELAKQEMREKMNVLRSGSILMLAGAWVASFAVLTLIGAVVTALSAAVGLIYSMLIVGGALLLIALALAMTGLRRVRKTNLKPEQTIETLREDKEWLKELA